MYMPSKICRHVFASPQPKASPPPLSFPLTLHLTPDQINGLVSREYVLDVKLVHITQHDNWVALEHTNLACSKIIVHPSVQAMMDESPSFAKANVHRKEVSVRLTIDQRNGLISKQYRLAVKLFHARPKSIFWRILATAKFVDLEHELDLHPWKWIKALKEH